MRARHDTRRLSAAQARRFLVRRHLLAPPRRLPARAASVLECVRRLGSLQFDPLEIPGARNHELILHARIRGYRRGWCERWLYGPPGERRLFEAVNKGLSILPADELHHFRLTWARARTRYEPTILRQQADEARRLLAHIAEHGPLATADASRLVGGAIDWHWGRTARGRAVLEALFYCGRVGIARREGNARTYDVIERLFPAELLARPLDPEAAARHRLLSRARGLGLYPGQITSEVLLGTGSAADRRRVFAELVAAGAFLPVEVDGLRGPSYVLAEEAGLLDERDDGPAEVTLLAPLDPLLWNRRLLGPLWGFDYKWEVYTPVAKRQYGHYVLPLLYGDELVGRIEPRVNREAGALVIAGLWSEPGRPVAGALARALDEALEAYRIFVGADRVVWPGRRRRR